MSEPDEQQSVELRITGSANDYKKNFKVIDESLAMLLCFVVPRSRNIWMSAFYLRLVEDDAQLAYVLGHELSHVICEHGKDFCFVETVREAGLLATGDNSETNDDD